MTRSGMQMRIKAKNCSSNFCGVPLILKTQEFFRITARYINKQNPLLKTIVLLVTSYQVPTTWNLVNLINDFDVFLVHKKQHNLLHVKLEHFKKVDNRDFPWSKTLQWEPQTNQFIILRNQLVVAA